MFLQILIFMLQDRQILMVQELIVDKNSHTMLNDKDREKLAFLNSYTYSSKLDSPRK